MNVCCFAYKPTYFKSKLKGIIHICYHIEIMIEDVIFFNHDHPFIKKNANKYITLYTYTMMQRHGRTFGKTDYSD